MISVVLPVRNEEDSVRPLWEATRAVLESQGGPWEILFVDDASTDRSLEAMKEARAADPRVRILKLARQGGQSAALAAGVAEARGEIVVTMDADLQHDPADIPALLAALEGADLATGWRRERRDPWIRRISSSIARAFRGWFTRDVIHDSACNFRAMRRACFLRLHRFRNMHRFLPALFLLEGFRVVEVPIRHRARRFGRSKYGIWNRLWVGIADTLAVSWMRRRRMDWEIEERYE